MSPNNWRIDIGDCRDVLRALPAQSAHTVVTSPPYFGLRDYGTGEWEGGDPACDHTMPSRVDAARAVATSTLVGSTDTQGHLQEPSYREACGKCGARRVDRQIGLEPTPDEFVAALVEVFREVRRVLRDDGTVWLNLGDSYAQGVGMARGQPYERHSPVKSGLWEGTRLAKRDLGNDGQAKRCPGLKPKDLIGVPWMVAFALRADGWYLRSDIVWSKPNPMPESVTDRPTKSHEYVFLLSKGPRYFYDSDAIREDAEPSGWAKQRAAGVDTWEYGKAAGGTGVDNTNGVGGTFGPGGRNKRSVWTVATQPYTNAHFATFPPKLIEPCILAGAPEQACGECGAPWVRVVERTYLSPLIGTGTEDGRLEQGRNRNVKRMGDGVDVKTLGFEPSCSHYDHRYLVENPQARSPRKREQRMMTGDWWRRTRARRTNPAWPTVPGVVLDPFAGVGTTGMVALRHNRSFVGVELNPEYAAMARTRIETAVRLGFRAPQNGPVQIPGQASIFDLDGAA